MIAKIKAFFNKYRQIVLQILDWVQGIMIILQVLLPQGKLREILGGIFIILYGSTTARYYLPKRKE